MPDFREIGFSVEAKNAAAARRALESFIGTFEELGELIAKFGGTIGKFDGDINMFAKIETAGAHKAIRDLTTDTNKLGTALSKREQSNKRQLKLEEQGATLARQRLSQAKQELGALGPLTSGYKIQAERVQQLTEEHRRAQGIMPNSVQDIQEIGSALQAQASKLTLAEQKTSGLTNEIDINARSLLRAQGIQKGSVQSLQFMQAKQLKLATSLKLGSKAQIAASKAAQLYGQRIAAASGKTTSFISILGKLGTIQSGILAISSAFGQVGGAINQVVNRTKSVEAFSLALQNVGLSSVETAQKFNVAAQSAINLGAPVEQVEKAFKRIVPALRAIGSSSSDTNKFIEGLTARTQVLGLTTEESGRLQEAFAQVLSKGKLQAEELTQQISEVDGAFRTQFADALGVSIDKLGELVESGQVTSTVFVDAFLKMENGAERLKGKIENGTATVQQLQNNIANIQTKTLESLGAAAEPGIRAILELSNAVAKFIQEAVDSPWGQALINAFNSIAGAIKNLGKLFIGLAKALGTILAPLGPLVQAFSNLAGPLAAILAPLVALRLASIAFTKVNDKMAESIGNGNKTLQLFRISVKQLKGSLLKLIKGDVSGFFNGLTQSFRSLGKATSKGLLGDFPSKLKGLIDLRKKAAAPVAGDAGAKKYEAAAASAKLLAAKSAGIKAAALGAKAAIVGIGAAGLGAFAVVGLAAAAGALAFNEYQKSIGALIKPIKESESTLKSLGIESEKATTFVERLKDGFISVIPFARQLIQGIGSLVSGIKRFGRERAFEDAMAQNQKQLKGLSDFLDKKGAQSFLDYGKIAKMSAEDLVKFRKGSGAVKTSLEAQAGALQQQIDKMKAAGNVNVQEVQQLERQKDAFLEKAAAIEIAMDGTRRFTGIIHTAVDGEGTLTEKLEASNKALETRKQKLEAVTAALGAAGQEKLNQGLITEGQLAVRNAAIREAAAKSNLDAIQKEIDLNFKRQAESNQDVVALRTRARELGADRVAAAKEAQAAEQELSKAMLDRIKEVKQENDTLIQSYSKLKDLQKGGFNDLTSGITSAFDTFKTAINKAATIEFLVTGDKSILDDALRLEKDMFELQFEIDKIKRQVQQAEKQHKLEMISLETQAQIAMLKAEPATVQNQARIQALQKVIGMTETLSKANAQMFRVENFAAELQVSQAQQALNTRLKAAGIQPTNLVPKSNLTDIKNFVQNIGGDLRSSLNEMGSGTIEALRDVESIGQQGLDNIKDAGAASKKEVQASVKALQTGAEKLATDGQAIDQNFFGLDVKKVKAALGESVNTMNAGLSNVQGNVQKLNTEFGNTSTAIQKMGTDSENSLKNISKAISATNSLKTAMEGVPFGSRATGGPVTGGATYKVNDGGGRESFVDTSGKVSLLPAARNVKWRAPKSGYVLNANDTSTLIKNQKINASITAATRSAKPARESQGVTGIVPSGTLIKQMGSMMKGGDTQRITNNVTIQSQSPVMDASKLLTDINIMKARRGGRL